MMSYTIIAVVAVVLCCAVLLFWNGLFGVKGFSDVEISRISVVAHRAAATGCPENSLSAVKKSLADGVDVIELDVRLTRDGEIILCHDATVNRTTDGSGTVSEMSMNELRELHLKSPNGVLTEERLPSLGEVLECVNGSCVLLIEAKTDGNGEQFAKALINETALYGAAPWVAVQSFDDTFLWHMYRLGNPCRLEKLLYFKFPGLPFAYDGGITAFNAEKYFYVSSINFYYMTLSPFVVKLVRSWGKGVKIWTVNTPADTPHLDVDAVITDFPHLWGK